MGLPKLEKRLYSDPVNWVDKYADYLYRFAISRLLDEELARDLVQDTFLAALQQLSKFEGKSDERTWLTAILKNKIVDVYRKKGKVGVSQIAKAESEQEGFFDPENGHWNAEHYPKAFGLDEENPLLRKELGQILATCMKKLPALWFAVFSMKHMDDLKSESICAELKLSDANFWVIMHRTKLNLRACVQKNWN
ncbi:MAG: sigma-70 family RNA polymerase sigma factor [Hymenobacter sp.]|nr:MAG: sigma-70 family RNA polymerase sigma factor [Hymenobacter sp.]